MYRPKKTLALIMEAPLKKGSLLFLGGGFRIYRNNHLGALGKLMYDVRYVGIMVHSR